MIQQNTFFSLEQVIDPQPLTVSSETPLHEVISLMYEGGNSGTFVDGEDPNPEDDIAGGNSSCVLVVEGDRLQGIFTERDLVKLVAIGADTHSNTVGEMMSLELITLTLSGDEDVFTALSLLREHRIRHLPVVGDRHNLIGLITSTSLYQRLQLNQAELKQAHQELSYHVNNSPLAVVEWDSNFCVQRWTKQAEQIFGWQESEVRGKHWQDWQFVLEEDLDSVIEITRRLLNGEKPRNLSSNRNYTKDGSVIDCEWHNSVLLDEAGNLVSIFSLVQDVSQRQNALRDRTRAEKELQTRLQQQQVIAEIGQFALATKDLISISQRVVKLVANTLEVEYCKVLELLPDGKELLLKAGFGWHDGLVGRARVRADINSQAGYTLLESQPVLVDDLNSETRFNGPPLLTDHQVVSGVSVIIPNRDSPYGILGVHTTQHRVFTQDDINFIQAIANIIAQAYERQKVELELKQSEQKFKAIFDQTFQFIGLLEPNGNLIEANKTALDFVGLTTADVVGKPFWETPWWSMSGEIQKLIKQGIERAAQGEFVRFEVQHPGTENRIVTVDFSLTPIRDETGQVVMLIPEGRNISDRKQAEAELQKSNQILQAISSLQTQYLSEVKPEILFDGMLESLLSLSDSEYGFIGEIIIAADGSPIMEESYMKFRGRSYLKTHAITNIAWNKETRAFYAENAPKGMEFHNLQTLFGAVIVTGEPVIANSPSDDPRRGGLPEGHPPLNAFLGVPFYKNNTMTGMVGIANKEGGYDETLIDYLQPFLDTCSRIIEAYQSDRQKREAEARNREQAALLDVATDAIMVRGLDNRLLFWNQGAERLYGWTEAEALQEDVEELLYRRSLSKLSKIQLSAINQGEWQGELNQVTKAGKEILVRSRWTVVKDTAGNPESFLIVNTDITEQKELETQVLRTQRLESLGTLAGGIAHDLNNILAPIVGFSKLLPLKLPEVDEQTKGFFKIMENNANRGTALVKQILTFSRGLEGERGIVQIRHLVAEIAQIIRETFPKSIELETNLPKSLWTVNADVNQLHQVLMNLVVNARDAMPDGGKLTINGENTTVDAEYARLHLDATEGSYVLITVRDTGVGIPPEVIDRIFEPFFTTKEVGRGTGLGLSTAIGIIKSHGGFIDVISDRQRSDRGTQFKVFLPASDIQESNSEEAEEILEGNEELVLIVDDEAAILEVTKATLETYNYKVLTASNGMEAIATYAQNQSDIDLVIMDIMMPKMDGKTAIRTLKQINSDLKIIAVSGLIDRQEIVAELNGDVTAFINKPYSNDELLQTIREIIIKNNSHL